MIAPTANSAARTSRSPARQQVQNNAEIGVARHHRLGDLSDSVRRRETVIRGARAFSAAITAGITEVQMPSAAATTTWARMHADQLVNLPRQALGILQHENTVTGERLARSRQPYAARQPLEQRQADILLSLGSAD